MWKVAQPADSEAVLSPLAHVQACPWAAKGRVAFQASFRFLHFFSYLIFNNTQVKQCHFTRTSLLIILLTPSQLSACESPHRYGASSQEQLGRILVSSPCQLWRNMPVIRTLRRLRQEACCDLKASLGYKASSCSKTLALLATSVLMSISRCATLRAFQDILVCNAERERDTDGEGCGGNEEGGRERERDKDKEIKPHFEASLGVTF